MNYNFDASGLAALAPDVFQQSVAIVDAHGYRRKYLWDFFNAHYSCPLKEKVGILTVLSSSTSSNKGRLNIVFN